MESTPGSASLPPPAAPKIDVTTEETDAAGKPVSLTSVGVRAVIGGSSYDWYGDGAGGVAYVGTFGQAKYEPGGLGDEGGLIWLCH